MTTEEIRAFQMSRPLGFRGFEHNVSEAVNQQVLDWVMDYTGYNLEPGDLWVNQVQDQISLGYLTRRGEQAMNRFMELKEAGKVMPFLFGDPETRSPLRRMIARIESQIARLSETPNEFIDRWHGDLVKLHCQQLLDELLIVAKLWDK